MLHLLSFAVVAEPQTQLHLQTEEVVTLITMDYMEYHKKTITKTVIFINHFCFKIWGLFSPHQ